MARQAVLVLGISLALDERQEVVEALVGHVVAPLVDELCGNTLGLVGDLENILMNFLYDVIYR